MKAGVGHVRLLVTALVMLLALALGAEMLIGGGVSTDQARAQQAFCPPGYEGLPGCPPADRDGDGLADSADACPDVPAATPNGCPPPPPSPGGTAPESTPPPEPELRKTVVAAPSEGTVLVRVPGSNRYVELRDGETIPLGTLIDTSAGKVTLTSAANDAGAVQTSEFFDGIFQVLQTAGRRPVTELVLKGGDFRSCPRKAKRRSTGARQADASARRRRSTVRRLWGDGRGRFRTRGRYSSATVRGTKWVVEDRCDGTLTRVARGQVEVRDFVRRRVVRLRAGQRYLATGKGRRRGK